jgi:hypothetical protein
MKAPLFSRVCRISELVPFAEQVAASHQRAETAFLAALAAIMLYVAFCVPPPFAGPAQPAPQELAPSSFPILH